jgi:hypothetical protein
MRNSIRESKNSSSLLSDCRSVISPMDAHWRLCLLTLSFSAHFGAAPQSTSICLVGSFKSRAFAKQRRASREVDAEVFSKAHRANVSIPCRSQAQYNPD